MRIPALRLLADLELAGVALSVSRDGTGIVPCPAYAVTPALADAVRAWKPELVRALRTVRDGAPALLAACVGCSCEFVTIAGDTCPWCAVAFREPDSSQRPRHLDQTLTSPV